MSSTCPICGASVDHAAEHPKTADRNGGREYLQALCDSSGITFNELVSQLKMYQCGRCRGYFYNPWLSESARNSVFITGHPIHNVGWRNYQERREQRLNPKLQVAVDRLLEMMSSPQGEPTTYLEIGCPFQGLLLHFANDQEIEMPQQGLSTFGSMNASEYKRFLPSLRLFMRLGALARGVSDVLTRLQKYRHKLRGRWHPTAVSEAAVRPRRYFVPLQSSKFWGSNCAMYGNSCAAVAHQALGAEVLTYEQFAHTEHSFDAIGLFNVLDHQDSPLNLLTTCLEHSRLVLCLSHDAPFAPQHHIGLGREFFKSLEQTVAGCKVTELSKQSSNTVLFLITRESG